MRRVIVESPLAGRPPTWLPWGIRWLVATWLRWRNVRYARALVRECVLRGDAAIASHLLYPQAGLLRDDRPRERELGMEAGLAWSPVAEAVVVGVDLGISDGMVVALARHQEHGLRVEELSLRRWRGPGDWRDPPEERARRQKLGRRVLP